LEYEGQFSDVDFGINVSWGNFPSFIIHLQTTVSPTFAHGKHLSALQSFAEERKEKKRVERH
jgi:hypothetical protein